MESRNLIQNNATPSTAIAKLRWDLYNKLNKLPFYPNGTAKELITEEVIRSVLREDKSFNTSEDLEDLVATIYERAPKLFGMFVADSVTPLSFLKELLHAGFYDDSLPLPNEPPPNITEYPYDFYRIIDTQQWMFQAPVFSECSDVRVLNEKFILPIICEEPLGRGMYGTVYETKFHADHHTYSNPLLDKQDIVVAVKKLEPRPKNAKSSYEREVSTLWKLANLRHKHIITLLTAYEYKGQLHMVFPLAKYDLRRYMDTEPPIVLEKPYLCWLLKQIHGVAEALSKIHEFEYFENSSITLAPKEQKRIGLHRDLKPENLLLVFDPNDDRDIYGTIKIADFGQASLRSIKKGSKTRTVFGTAPYTAPEVEQKGGMISRPYDVWSLACIYMELLVWLVLEKEGSEVFNSVRFLTANAIYKGDEFYVCDDHNVCRLNPAVKALVHYLQGIFSKQTCLLQVLNIVYKEMFIINPDERIKAKILADKLKSILETARSESEQNLKFKRPIGLGAILLKLIAKDFSQMRLSHQPDTGPVGEPISAQDNPIIEVAGAPAYDSD